MTMTEPAPGLSAPLFPSDPAAPCTSYRVVHQDSAAGCEAAPNGIPHWSDTIRDLPVATGQAAALAEAHGQAWLVGADGTSCSIDAAGVVTPQTGWALRAARFLSNRKGPPMPPKTEPAVTLIEIPLDKIVDHPHNIRHNLGDLAELTASIEEGGVLIPIVVLPADADGNHVLIDGHRRRGAAAKTKSKKPIPALVRDLTEAQVIETMLVTGLQHAEISPIEEARGYSYLTELGSTIKSIAETVGRTQKHVKGRLALMVLPAGILDLVHAGDVTLGTAEDLLAYADDTEALEWYEQARRGGDRVGNAEWAINNHVAEREKRILMDAAVAELEADGLTRFVEDRWYPPYDLSISKTMPLSLLKLTAAQGRKHANEPCHQVYLRQAGVRSVERIVVCTNPKRHTTKAKVAQRSDIQMKSATYTKVKSDKDLARLALDRRKREAEGRQLEHAKLTLPTVTALDDDLLMLAVHMGAGYNSNSSRVNRACELTDLPVAKNSWESPDAWGPFAEANPLRALATLAVAAATLHNYEWAGEEYSLFLSWLLAHGYEPTDDEHVLIEEAFEYRLKNRDEERAYAAEQAAEDAENERIAAELGLDVELPDGDAISVLEAITEAGHLDLFQRIVADSGVSGALTTDALTMDAETLSSLVGLELVSHSAEDDVALLDLGHRVAALLPELATAS